MVWIRNETLLTASDDDNLFTPIQRRGSEKYASVIAIDARYEFEQPCQSMKSQLDKHMAELTESGHSAIVQSRIEDRRMVDTVPVKVVKHGNEEEKEWACEARQR